MTDLLQRLIGNALPYWAIQVIAGLATSVVVLLLAVGSMMIMVWLERRVVARMQDRLGPNRVGPAGVLQSIADGAKMFTKEDIVPRGADRWVHFLAPVVTVAPVAMMFAVIPWGRGLVPVELQNGALFALAASAISGIGLMMAGWGSSNKFALLGAMRAVAQLISYEIPAVLAILSAVLVAGTMSLTGLVEAQGGVPLLGGALLCGAAQGCDAMLYSGADGAQRLDLGLGWAIFTPVGLVGFGIFLIGALAEGERTPFDIPEADSEIVAGHTTEYSGIKFALFYVGQYVLNLALAMLTAIVFLGGWQGPGVQALAGAGHHLGASILSAAYLLLKTWGLFFVMIWVRGAFPRLRADQLMALAWKFLLPLALFNLLSAALWVVIFKWGSAPEWTGGLVVPGLGFDLLGWLVAAPAWLRQVAAWAATAAISVWAFRWLRDIASVDPDGEPALEPAAAEG